MLEDYNEIKKLFNSFRSGLIEIGYPGDIKEYREKVKELDLTRIQDYMDVPDSGFDAACAHNAGLPAILIRWASGRGAELAGRPPEYTVTNAEELRAALANVAAAAANGDRPRGGANDERRDCRP